MSFLNKDKFLKKIIVPVILLIIVVGISGCNKEKEAITVFAASSLTESMKEIKEVFEKENPNVEIQLNLDSSSRLRTQIEQGMEVDLYLSANKKHYEALNEKEMIASGVNFLSNSLVLVVPKDNPAKIEKPEDLINECKLVIAQKEVPVGNYTLQVLEAYDESLGNEYKEKVLKNVVSEENNVKQVVAKVVLGEADAAFVYGSDVTMDNKDKLKVIEISEKYNVKAAYWMGSMKGSENNKNVQALYNMITEESGYKIFEKYGFGKAE
ncbi:molybdate ABC transporter substrate-binding protein [Clostridium sediminicola]|uniref:molybdate ABC transporter substrate-binding protein n=1 Tax=Clostridium sediminicola TaxID=3114879 RepID=UPI0031F244BC